MTLKSLLGLSTIMAYRPLTGKSDLFVPYLAGAGLPMALLGPLTKRQRRFMFNKHSLMVSAALLAGGGL